MISELLILDLILNFSISPIVPAADPSANRQHHKDCNSASLHRGVQATDNLFQPRKPCTMSEIVLQLPLHEIPRL